MSYVLGLDLGTGSLKGIIFDKTGKFITSTSADYPLLNPAPGFSEQNPSDWVEALKKVFIMLNKKVPDLKEKLKGVSFSGQMHSLVLLDENGEVLRPSILWNDVRTTKQCDAIMATQKDTLLSITKNIALEGFTLPKILWVQENEPEIWEKTRHILLPKDYIRYWLTGKMNMDYSDAAGTLLFDMDSRSWSKTIAELYNIPIEYLPKLLPSTGYVGDVKITLQRELGFVNPIKVFAGGADNACSAIGAGIVADDVALASIGTSGVFLATEKRPLKNYNGKLHLFHHAMEEGDYSMGVTLAAGNSLDWYKKTFGSEQSYQELLDNISMIEPGAEGLIFTPYIVGERTPHVDSQVRGSFLGIDTSHTLNHFTRAVLEGITFSLKDSQTIMREVASKKFNRIVSVGGGAKNKDWLQIQADIFNTPVVTLKAEEGPGTGAAMIAAVGLKWYNSFDECKNYFVEYTDEVLPNKDYVEKYEKIYNIYRDVYDATKGISKQLQELDGD